MQVVVPQYGMLLLSKGINVQLHTGACTRKPAQIACQARQVAAGAPTCSAVALISGLRNGCVACHKVLGHSFGEASW
jgi:hypothetical protein